MIALTQTADRLGVLDGWSGISILLMLAACLSPVASNGWHASSGFVNYEQRWIDFGKRHPDKLTQRKAARAAP